MPAEPNITRRMQPLLGTFVEIGVYHEGSVIQPHNAIDAAFERIATIHQQMSLFDASSDLSKLNLAGGDWVTLPRDTLRVLKLARALTHQSDHRFNCTVGGHLLAQHALPQLSATTFLAQGRADDIEIIGSRARLLRPVYITLDGIAKGYAIDCAVAVLKRKGQRDSWISAGGDMRACGEMHLPVFLRQLNGVQRALGELRNASIASSQAKALFDPNYPAVMVRQLAGLHNEIVSVIARFAWRADALCKVMLATPLAQRHRDIAKWRAVLLDETPQCAA